MMSHDVPSAQRNYLVLILKKNNCVPPPPPPTKRLGATDIECSNLVLIKKMQHCFHVRFQQHWLKYWKADKVFQLLLFNTSAVFFALGWCKCHCWLITNKKHGKQTRIRIKYWSMLRCVNRHTHIKHTHTCIITNCDLQKWFLIKKSIKRVIFTLSLMNEFICFKKKNLNMFYVK